MRDPSGFPRHPIPCAFYRSAAGNEPVREGLLRLPADERRQVGIDIKTVQYGWPLGLPWVDSLGGGLWEVRSRLATRIARTLFCFHAGQIILLHGFIKKTHRTPLHALVQAQRRQREVQGQPSRG